MRGTVSDAGAEPGGVVLQGSFGAWKEADTAALVHPYWIARAQELVDAGQMTISAEDAFEVLLDALQGALFTRSLGRKDTSFIERDERINRATLCSRVVRPGATPK